MSINFHGLIVFLGTKDLATTDYFYTDLLGLNLYKDQGVCKIYKVPGGGYLGFCTHMPVVHKDKSPIITLLSEDVDGVYSRLCIAGISLSQPPSENPRFNIYHFFATDPNGYCLEVQRFM